MKISTQFFKGATGGWLATTYADGTELATAHFDTERDAHAAANWIEATHAAMTAVYDDAVAKRAKNDAAADMLAKYVNAALRRARTE